MSGPTCTNWVKKKHDINSCIACNKACLDHAFVGRTVSCLVNTRAFHETKLIIDEDMIPKSDRLNNGVVGSELAGLAFATTTVRVGHCVTLYNSSKEIRGKFNMARHIPGKEEFNQTI